MAIWDLILGAAALVLFVITSSVGGIVFSQFGTDFSSIISTLLGAV